MKRSLFVLLAAAVVIGMAFYFKERRVSAVVAPEPEAAVPPPAEKGEAFSRVKAAPVKPEQAATRPKITGAPVATAASPETAGTEAPLTLNDTMETLLSPQATFEQKQKAWSQLKDKGQLDEVINELEHRWTDQPRDAALPTTLGQAYLKRAGMTQDVREQAILGMKADKTFDDALALDPSNWQARFTKAVGMSYWPAQMNKGQEVIDQFQMLIQQQEGQAPQPEFAQSYRWLGEQYSKAGQADEAQKAWQRGLALFPDNPELKKRVTPGK
jgi:tetratricopeptide (TPR) repeat protein